MPFRLLSRALAAHEWGWYEGLHLVDRGHEDALRELLLYLHSKRRWRTAEPVYRQLKADPQTGQPENTVQLRARTFVPGTRPWGYSAWYMYGMDDPNSRTVNLNHLCAVRVPFSEDNCLQYGRIEYMVEEGGGLGFYYLTVHDWMARCSDPRECVALLDSLDPTALFDDFVSRCQQNAYFRHLETCLCHDDPPRKAYIQRKMGDLERECGGYEWNCTEQSCPVLMPALLH